MTLTTIIVQDVSKAQQTVLLDKLTGQTYAMPIYKIGLGDVGDDDGLVSSSNPLPTTASDSNAISTTAFNSRDRATLAAGATFQGIGEDVLKYGRAGISITSTTATATGTVTMEVSHDNVNWSGPTRTWATFDAPLMWNIVEQYFRIKFVNDSVEAANCSIQVEYSGNADIVLGHQVNEILPASTEAQATRPTNDFGLDTARVHIKGQSAEFFFGENNTVGTDFEDVYPPGGDIAWQTVAAKIKIKSTHAADTAAGLGLQSVEIHGLSATGEDQSEVLALSGTTPVESALTYIRVNLVHNEEVGTYGGSHQGTIEWRVTNATFANGALLGQMTGLEGAADSSVQFGYGEAQNGFTSVPLGKVMYITRIEVIPKTAKSINIALYEREGILTVADPFLPRRVIWSADEIVDTIEKEFASHIKIKALTDLWFRVEGTGGAANGVAVWCDYYLVDADANGA